MYDYYFVVVVDDDVLVWMAFFAIDCDDVDVMATMMTLLATMVVADDGYYGDGCGVDDDDVVVVQTMQTMRMIHLPMPAFHLMHCR